MDLASAQNVVRLSGVNKPTGIGAKNKMTTINTDTNGDFQMPLYLQLMELEEKSGIISNVEPFECNVCTSWIERDEGLLIRNCLHQSCKDCIRHTIIYSDEAEVKCPQCDNILQDREIRALLTPEDFDKYLMKTLRIAESTTKNSFHCKLANCDGWCICEDNVNQFVCPQCSSVNCLQCRAIHDGKNCKEYQNDLTYGGLNENQRSEMCLDDIVRNNLGMRCPSCRIVIMKRDGCDAITCKMCSTEICWATKGPRWGPLGRGDQTGGCRCKVNGQKCHPKCTNCH